MVSVWFSVAAYAAGMLTGASLTAWVFSSSLQRIAAKRAGDASLLAMKEQAVDRDALNYRSACEREAAFMLRLASRRATEIEDSPVTPEVGEA